MAAPPPAPELLVVDDHADTRRMLSRVLRMAGYRVSTAGDFDAALAVARSRRVDLVMTDVWLPGRDGCDLLAAVAGLYPVRAIVLSGLDDGPHRLWCDGFGARFLRKPVDVTALLTAAAAELATAGSGADC